MADTHVAHVVQNRILPKYLRLFQCQRNSKFMSKNIMHFHQQKATIFRYELKLSASKGEISQFGHFCYESLSEKIKKKCKRVFEGVIIFIS